MITHSEIQGTPEWLALRRDYFTASEAPAMMGVSPYCTRTELLYAKKTGITPDVDERTQSRFDAGHAAEAAFRPIAEHIVGVDFYPVTGSIIEIDGLKLLASFDGLSADDSIVFEHKLFSQKLADMCLNMGDVTDPAYYWQLEQQLLVSGAERVEFFTSDGTELVCARTTYTSRPDRRQVLIAAWKQFAKDLEAYVPQEYIPAPVAKAVTALPAVAVQVTGSIDVRDNFKAFQTALTDFIDNRLIRDPKTDQDFADLDLQIKALKDAESAIKAAEGNMLSQVESVDTAKRMMDTLHTMARDNRLMAEKLLEAKKLSVKTDIVNEGRKALLDHVEALNARLGKPYMPPAVADFQGAIKGKRSIDGLREAVNVTLANAKIAASAQADRIELNLKSLRELAKEHAFLFSDTAQLVTTKANDDLVLLINSRINEHTAKEAARIEAEREKIRAEEAAKLAKAAADEAARIAAEEAKRATEAAAVSQPKPEAVPPVPPALVPVATSPAPEASKTVLAFLNSRQWQTPAAERTARSTLIEFERFCASEQLRAA
jgi:putative phage-type endonuclease